MKYKGGAVTLIYNFNLTAIHLARQFCSVVIIAKPSEINVNIYCVLHAPETEKNENFRSNHTEFFCNL